MKDRETGYYNRKIKRPIDFICALLGMVIMSPLLLIVWIMVRVKLGSPVIFRQIRPGLNEKLFTLYKFRTMTDEKDKNGNDLSDSIRLTKFGKWLRSTSLDELPELINILKGDMSIVGPRPQLVRDMFFMTEEQRKRHRVRPGLTGLAQVSGRNTVGWEEKLQYDLEYIQRITLSGDCKIIFRTVTNVIKREGINTEGMETAEDLGDYLLRVKKIPQELYESQILRANNLVSDSLRKAL